MGNKGTSITIKNIKYEIIKKLGEGGFGNVIQVKSKLDNKYYAIKEIKIENKMKDKIKDIKKEADILSKFKHNNIVKYLDSDLYKGKFFILMEYCEGQNLRNFIDNYSKDNVLIEEEFLYYIIKQICEAIKEIHKENIIHRDIKPENIFINDDNHIKIGDFGISKQFNQNKEYTKTLIKAGSIEYMAPEIIKDGIYNKKSDMFSLGCIIYELFNLRNYFGDKNRGEIKKLNSNIYNDKWQVIINSLLQSDYNKRMDIKELFDFLLKIYKNSINGEIYINKDNIYKSNLIINSFENYKREYKSNDSKNDDKYENEREIKKNIEIIINGKKIEFTYYYKFKVEGIYQIEYIFKNDLKKTNHMFCGCHSLTSLNLSNFNTQNVINMSKMFYGCNSLNSLNLSNFNTQNVTDMSWMFSECNSLTNLDLLNFNTRNVTDMNRMFFYCKSLTNLNLIYFNTRNVTDVSWMFLGCNSLKKLNLSNFNTQNVTNMNEMFKDCKSLTNLNLSNFNTQNVKYMKMMFLGCNSLKKDDIITKDNKILKEFYKK